MTKTTPGTDEAIDPYAVLTREDADTLNQSADYLERHGLHKGYFIDPMSIWPDGKKVDARGALNHVVNGDAEECGRPGDRADRISLLLIDHLDRLDGGIEYNDQQGIITILSDWSDHAGRTKADVADGLRACAAGLLAKFAQRN